MKIKNDKLKVYEFLFNRVHFTEEELKEYEHLKRMELLESLFNQYLKQIEKTNIEIYWHLILPIRNQKEIIECMIATAYSIHLFKILDLNGPYEINPFNILLKDETPILDLNTALLYYEAMKDLNIEQEGFNKPIFFNYVILNENFSVVGNKEVPFLTSRTLANYLNKIAVTSSKKKYPNSL